MKKKKSNEELLAEINQIIGEQVPVEIKNIEAYHQHLKYKHNPIHTIKLIIGSKVVPITHPQPVINRRIREALEAGEISEEEAIRLKARKKVQADIKLRAMAQLTKAYGTIVNKHGVQIKMKSIFDSVETQMIELFGRMFTATEVHEVCLTQWRLDCHLNSVQDFRVKHITEISKRIEEHKRTFSDIRLGHKRSRLEELVWMYNKRKRIYEISGKGEDHRLLLSTLAQIKQEAEGDVLRIDGNITIGLDNTIAAHIQKDLAKTMPLKEIIMGRIAAKTGSDPLKLVNYIQQSIYRQVLDAEDAVFEEMPQYPSSQNYDFDKIKRVNEQEIIKQEIEKKIDFKPSQKTIDEGESLRQMLLKKLSGKSGDLNQEKNNLTGNFETSF
jgi:hypothetical protein